MGGHRTLSRASEDPESGPLERASTRRAAQVEALKDLASRAGSGTRTAFCRTGLVSTLVSVLVDSTWTCKATLGTASDVLAILVEKGEDDVVVSVAGSLCRMGLASLKDGTFECPGLQVPDEFPRRVDARSRRPRLFAF